MWWIIGAAIIVAIIYVVDRKVILNGVKAIEWEVEVLKARFTPAVGRVTPPVAPKPVPTPHADTVLK